MINVKPTDNHERNIKLHKKLLEKWDMWNFAFLHNGTYYFVTSFKKITGKLSGYLILDAKGNVPLLSIVREPAYYLVLYNTMLHNTITEIGPQMKKSMITYEEMYQLLKKNRTKLVNALPQMEDEIDKLIEQNYMASQRSEKIREIYYNVGNIQREVTRGTGYFDIDYIRKLQGEYGKYSELMYTFGKKEQSLKNIYIELKQSISTNKMNLSRLDHKNMMELIKSWLSTVDTSLKESVATFEQDERGNRMDVDLNNIKESLTKNREEIGKRDFEKTILPIIRNPK